MKRIIFYLMIIGALSSCNHLDQGTVITKHYEPKNTTLIFIPITINQVTMMTPYWITDNEDWVLTIEAIKDGDTIHDHIYVTRDCYNRLSSGDTWSKTDDCSFSDDNNTKKKKE